MGALPIVWLALPVAGLFAALVCLPIAWPRASDGASREWLAIVTALGAAQLAWWAIAIGLGLRTLSLTRDRFSDVGAMLTAVALLGTLVISIARLHGRPAWRARAWLLAHALLLAAYTTDIGRDGVGQML